MHTIFAKEVERNVLFSLIFLSLWLLTGMLLHASEDSPRSTEVVLTDEHLSTACGPISGFCALRAVGVDTSLEEMVALCNWTEGELTRLDTLLESVTTKSDIHAVAVRISPKQLMDHVAIEDHSAILPIAKFSDEIDHAICVTGSSGEAVRVIDYPEMSRFIHTDDLAEVWDGAAILVSRKPPTSEFVRIGRSILPGVVIGFFVVVAFSHFENRRHAKQ